MLQVTIPIEKVDGIIGAWGGRREALIDILQDIQDVARYLPRPALEHLSKELAVPLGEIYHIATFYKAFSIEPKGKYVVQVCLGTACHVRGGRLLADRISHDLAVKPGKTTGDRLVTLETVGCVGACALGPIVTVNGEISGKMTQPKLVSMMKKWRG
ncbi:MAG: NAD(P)H-dependent oxidoreductase subunit E [Deltaproteobacteria bacterium]|nr:NAD(P)H-dependent oxidoreductase subunit E [Deltaproteobacteria bacterium]